MNRLKTVVLFAVVALGACELSHAQVMDPVYGFPFGYTLGAQWSLRNRLPAPPYFSIYPPVYYGKRYVRPYGESPYASFPLLGQVPGYAPVPAERSISAPRMIVNPHAPCCSDEKSSPQDNANPAVMIITQNKPGKMKVIVNPYAQEQVATAGN
jgi:hypothetical protein